MNETNHILLVTPHHDERYGVAKLNNHPFIQKKAFITPLNLAVLAALTPPQFQVEIWDENVRGVIDGQTVFAHDYDIVGVTGFSVHFNRAVAVSANLRDRGIMVVVGGAGVTERPELYRGLFDILFIGEAERIWPQFLKDWQEGKQQAEYHESGRPEMSLSPPPKWDSIAHLLQEHYLLGAVQTTRGCPFNCEFCNMWKIFGNRMRLKEPIDRVVDEVKTLQSHGIKEIFFAVDNFAGHPAYSKRLLKELITLNATFPEPIGFRAELSINIAHDQEMLDLLTAANFEGVFVGIESSNIASLRETNKQHNLQHDLVDSCHTIMSTGIPVDGAMIVGFDHDDENIFERHFQFLQKACIPNPKLTILRALPGTELWDRLLPERRLIDLEQLDGAINDPDTEYVANAVLSNIIPLKMSRRELFSGYVSLFEKIVDWDNFTARIMGFISNVKGERQNALRGEKTFHNTEFFAGFVESLPPAARSCALEILMFTKKTRPTLLKPVAVAIMRNHSETINIAQIAKKVLDRIRFEEALPTGMIESFILKEERVNPMPGDAMQKTECLNH